jgi:tRNA(Ile)-lysidine synthase TilS/MesJ
MEVREIERTIIKKYRKKIWAKFVRAVKDYELIQENDVIGVCISGGKDSFLMAKCMQELQKHGQFKYELKFIVMDPGYCKIDKQRIKDNAEKMNIPIEWFESNIFEVLEQSKEEFPCYMCARMRRGYLYSKAKELGCNKIALGHHMDDVIETIMLNIFYNGTFGSMPPKLHSDNFEGMELIRPMYLIKEEDIKSWANTCELQFLNCGCSVTKEKYASKRREIKELIANLKKTNKNIDINIFRSAENVNLNTIIGYYKDKVHHSFLDDYNKK